MASSPPSDQHSPSSMLSPWPAMNFNNPFPGLLQEELENPTAKGVSFSPQPLSSQASMGGSTTKVSKRRSRAVTKPPIRVLSADRSNFRDMVQKLTGIPTSPSPQGNRFQQLWGNNNPSAIFKPMPTRPESQNDAAAAQSLPTLDTSSAYLLLNGASQNTFMQNQINNRDNLSFLQSLQHAQPHMGGGGGGGGGGSFNTAFYNELGNYNPSSSGGGGLDLKSLFASQYDASKGTNMYSERVGGEVFPKMLDMEHLHRIRQAADFESLFMGNDKLDDFLPSRMHPNVDSWLSSDAIHTSTPKMELAHSA